MNSPRNMINQYKGVREIEKREKSIVEEYETIIE